MKETTILAIESSCDETAAAVVQGGRTVLSNCISSQIALHQIYGGVVPEIASRKHLEAIDAVVREAMKTAKTGWEEIDAIAVTYGPVSYTHLPFTDIRGMSRSFSFLCQEKENFRFF